MGTKTAGVLFVLAMVAVIVATDVFFFRHHTLERLSVNVGIALIFIGVYFVYVRRP